MRRSTRQQRLQFLLAIPLLLGLACASPPPPSTQPSRAEHLGFVFPASIGDLHLENFHEYPNPILGAVANYRLAPGDPLIVSVYIFPAPRFSDGSAQPIKEHAQDELRGLLQHYDGARQVSWPEELSNTNLAGRDLHQAALELPHADLGHAYSLLAISAEGESRIKFRISYALQDEDAAFAVRKFFEEFP